jgi:heme-degrading monooxygenase HmoA
MAKRFGALARKSPPVGGWKIVAQTLQPPPMYMNVFRSRKKEGYDAQAYARDAERMGELALVQPGFLDYKSFAAPDGETVTISIWESPEAAKAWARHPEHLEAQARGRRDYYAEFTMYVADEAKVRRYP